jgi:two-component system, NarL family, sensor kinase
VGSRPRDTHLTGADLQVLGSLAGRLAAAAYALRLSGDLEESHARLIGAREDERRRLRRDLHDGLGPQLAGVVMGVESIGAAVRRGDAARASDLARDVSQRARTAVDDVRRLVSGLRPPVLDDLGLVGALRTTVPGDAGSADGPQVTVTAGAGLPPLPAAVEVAAYRIASEAITNAIRHSGAQAVDVVLDVAPGALEVRVTDDGRGIPATATPGVGLGSMRDRATELGGWCRIDAEEPRGTTVLAHLPIGATR